jgi:glycerol kinase
LRADGGASVMDLLLQLQADQLGITVTRPRVQETTALGAAYLAGLAEGVWESLDELAAKWEADVEMAPRAGGDARYETWLRAVERSRGWARDSPSSGSGPGGVETPPG